MVQYAYVVGSSSIYIRYTIYVRLYNTITYYVYTFFISFASFSAAYVILLRK